MSTAKFVLNSLMHAVLLLGCLSAGGCGPSVSPVTADPNVAASALKSTLDAWKAGRKPDDLLNDTPPVRVIDEEWVGGAKLLDYAIPDSGRVAGPSLRCRLELTIEKPDGKVVKKTAGYAVSTAPAINIVRDELDNEGLSE